MCDRCVGGELHLKIIKRKSLAFPCSWENIGARDETTRLSSLQCASLPRCCSRTTKAWPLGNYWQMDIHLVEPPCTLNGEKKTPKPYRMVAKGRALTQRTRCRSIATALISAIVQKWNLLRIELHCVAFIRHFAQRGIKSRTSDWKKMEGEE